MNSVFSSLVCHIIIYFTVRRFILLSKSIFVLHLALNRRGRWGTTDDFTTTVLWELANSRPFHSPILFSHLFFCLPCFLPVSLSPTGDMSIPLQFASLCHGQEVFVWSVAYWILAQTSSLVTWSLYESYSILR